MSFRAAFFAPETSTSPQSRFPPSMKNLSMLVLPGLPFSSFLAQPIQPCAGIVRDEGYETATLG